MIEANRKNYKEENADNITTEQFKVVLKTIDLIYMGLFRSMLKTQVNCKQ